MKTSSLPVWCLLLLAVLTPWRNLSAQAPPTPAASPTPSIQSGGEVAAKSAADVWLGLVDDKRYGDSYIAAASIFQKLIDKDRWSKLAAGGREPLGKVLSRKLKDMNFTRTMPGAPDGQYVVIRYDTSFEKKATAIEVVTPMLDSDGQWKVAGYFIK